MIHYRCFGYGIKKEMAIIKKCFNIKKDLSVVIPTYNEAGNIKKLIDSIKKELNGIDYEIVIVDDNSKDRTPEIIDELSKRERVLAVHRLGIRGIFSAIKDGIKISNGKYIVTMDSDFSHPPKVIPELWKYREDYDIISGSRFTKRGDMKAPISRKYGSLLINWVCAAILGIKEKDIAGGFHLMKRKTFERINPQLDAVFGEFDFEIFYKAKKLGFKIKEIPFTYNFREEGESKMGGSAPELFGLLKYAWIYFKRAIELRLFN